MTDRSLTMPARVRRLTALLQARPITGFLLLAVLWSWGWWCILLGGIGFGALEAGQPGFGGIPWWMIGVALAGAWGPTLAGLVVTAAVAGPAGLKSLVGRCLAWRFDVRWHLAVWLLPPLLMAGGVLLFSAQGDPVGAFEPGRWQIALLALALSLPAGPLGEEIGWRGFLLVRLQSHLGHIRAALLLGFIWWFWHLPLFWAPVGTTVSGAPVELAGAATYLAYVMGLSLLFAAVYSLTGGSLLAVIVLHLTVNADLVTLFFPQLGSADVRAVRELSTVPLWLAALPLSWLALWRNSRNPGRVVSG